MILHYLSHGGANPNWIRECADMVHEQPATEYELSERRDWPFDEDGYGDEARAEAAQREERDRFERETGRPL